MVEEWAECGGGGSVLDVQLESRLHVVSEQYVVWFFYNDTATTEIYTE